MRRDAFRPSASRREMLIIGPWAKRRADPGRELRLLRLGKDTAAEYAVCAANYEGTLQGIAPRPGLLNQKSHQLLHRIIVDTEGERPGVTDPLTSDREPGSLQSPPLCKCLAATVVAAPFILAPAAWPADPAVSCPIRLEFGTATTTKATTPIYQRLQETGFIHVQHIMWLMSSDECRQSGPHPVVHDGLIHFFSLPTHGFVDEPTVSP
ncbi:hypothetical protein HPB49_005496 [Dermacentor silvarum]|uniref:Uncharacterized protein n=1 Tax=Dermacentor silvarum TaxID=543639 RepID=A0ACB8CV82_DERSI|nr:hypothetical protein HPB49_005496 [Dermacentor silvarum]